MLSDSSRHLVSNKLGCCFSDRLIGIDHRVCDKECVSEARVTGLTFSVGRLLHTVSQTIQTAARPEDLSVR